MGRDYLVTGKRLLREGNLSEALRVLRVALRQRPDDPEVLRALASTRLRLDRPREATRDLEAALDLDPGNAATQRLLGEAWAQLGKFEKSLLLYREAARSEGER